jgi:hypothetical protein
MQVLMGNLGQSDIQAFLQQQLNYKKKISNYPKKKKKNN